MEDGEVCRRRNGEIKIACGSELSPAHAEEDPTAASPRPAPHQPADTRRNSQAKSLFCIRCFGRSGCEGSLAYHDSRSSSLQERQSQPHLLNAKGSHHAGYHITLLGNILQMAVDGTPEKLRTFRVIHPPSTRLQDFSSPTDEPDSATVANAHRWASLWDAGLPWVDMASSR